MLLLDANILIEANNVRYPIERWPLYWDWLSYQAETTKIGIPKPIADEVRKKDDGARGWLSAQPDSFEIYDEAAQFRVQEVLGAYEVNDAPLTETDIFKIGQDPFLISYAATIGATIVTNEESAPFATKPGNKKIPDIAQSFGVMCINLNAMNEILDFTTNWIRP